MTTLKSALGYVTASTTGEHLQGLKIDFSASGLNTIIPGISGKAIYVFRYFVVVRVATDLTYFDGANALTGPVPLAANEAMVFTLDTRPWYECTSGNDFIINSSSAGQVSGRVYFTQVAP